MDRIDQIWLVVRAVRIMAMVQREMEMSRLDEKLAQAGGVSKQVSDKIEARADALIARGKTFDPKIDKAFSPHEAILDSGEKGLDKLENQLGQISNAPLESFGDSQEEQQTVIPPVSLQPGSVASNEPGN